MNAAGRYFERLSAGDLTLLAYFNLQDRFIAAEARGEQLEPPLWEAYIERLQLRLGLLLDLITEHNLPLYLPYVVEAMPDIPLSALHHLFPILLAERGLTANTEPPIPAESEIPPTVVLMCGGAGSGKSSMLARGTAEKDGILLSSDRLFPKLNPYPRLTQEAPDLATHTVGAEAMYYNERDRYRYLLLCKIPLITVDGTMSYLDLGLEMITAAQACGYFVHVFHVDADVEIAAERMRERAKDSGIPINPKWLMESHVRTARNFFTYLELADFTQNWSNNGEPDKMIRYTSSVKTSLKEVEESTYIISKSVFKYNQLVRFGGSKQVGDQKVQLFHRDGDKVTVLMVRSVTMLDALEAKARTPLSSVEWPENYNSLLESRRTQENVLEKFK